MQIDSHFEVVIYESSAFVQRNTFVAGALAGGSWLSQECFLEFG